MLIETQETPNPNVIKFYPDIPIMESGVADFKTMEQAENSPLALRLFAVDGVCGVFLATDYVAVTKLDNTSWDTVKTSVLTELMDCFMSCVPTFVTSEKKKPEYDRNDPIIQQIIAVIESEISPSVASHGGYIEFHSFVNGVVYVNLQGACAGCPAASLTLKGGVERTLRQHVPEVNEVREVLEF